MRSSLVTPGPASASAGSAATTFAVADLTGLYELVAAALGTPPGQLNLEGACLRGDRLRWFQRGNPAAGVASASVEVDLPGLLRAAAGQVPPETVGIGRVRPHDLGTVDGIPLAVTDAVALPGGRILLSAAAEDTPNPVDDGPLTAAALVLLDGDGDRVEAVAALPRLEKVEGLALHGTDGHGARLLAVVDADDPDVPSKLLRLRVHW
jgi:hypothetical protein